MLQTPLAERSREDQVWQIVTVLDVIAWHALRFHQSRVQGYGMDTVGHLLAVIAAHTCDDGIEFCCDGHAEHAPSGLDFRNLRHVLLCFMD